MFPLPKRTTRVYFGISAIGGVHAQSGFGDKNSQHPGRFCGHTSILRGNHILMSFSHC
jgi:hypothetical protein